MKNNIKDTFIHVFTKVYGSTLISMVEVSLSDTAMAPQLCCCSIQTEH